MSERGLRALLPLLVFVVGASSLGAEIAAARLLAPYFGASTIVWANTIGVVLVALSVGYWLGGRYADRHPHLRGLCLLVLLAAVLVALVPFAASPFLGFSVDAFEDVSVGSFAGSLFGVLILVAVPVTLLGAASPWAVRLAVGDTSTSGEVVGRLYAISTAGSLFGTMLAALLLIPFLGTQRTFLVFALALGLIAAVGLGWRYLVVPAVLAIAISVPVGTIKAADTGTVLLEAQTTHQYARVVERDDGTRVLELNEGQAVHSLYRPDSYLTGDYWDGPLVLPYATPTRPAAPAPAAVPSEATTPPEPDVPFPDGPYGHDRNGTSPAAAPDPRRIAILGNAAGTVARAYGRYHPGTRVDGVEIDGELTEIGREYFDLDNPRLRTYARDARPWLESAEGSYDAILVDAYRQPYIPFYMTTREFFETARERLAPGGIVILNVGEPEGSDEVERVLGRTMDAVFDHVARDPIEPTNTLLLASDAPISPARLDAAASSLPPDLRPLAEGAAERIGPRLPGGRVYTDDLAPVEWLIDTSWLEFASEE